MINNPGYVANMKLPDLGIGGGLALWGFRACAADQTQCCAVVAGYERAFGEHSDEVLAHMTDFVYVIGNEGRRRIGLGCSGCGGLTADELSIVATLASAQVGRVDACAAHLTWLLGKKPGEKQLSIPIKLATLFLRNAMIIDLPDISLSDWSAKRSVETSFLQAGNA